MGHPVEVIARDADIQYVDGAQRWAEDGPSLTRRNVGRLSAGLWMICGVLVALMGMYLQFPPGASRTGVVSVGLVAVVLGLCIWALPWDKWPRIATLSLVPPALALIALQNCFSGHDGYTYATLFFVVFMWLGLIHRPGLSLCTSPLLVAAYVLPLVRTGAHIAGVGIASVLYVVPGCVIVGETIAWVEARLRRSETSLAEARERFRSAFEQAPIGMALASLDGRLLRVNPAFAEIVGRGVDELKGVSIRELTHPDDWETNAAEIKALFAGETDHFRLEKRYLHSGGDAVWVSVTASVVRDPTGQPAYMIGQVEDITERRAMRDRLAHAAVHDLLTGLPNRVLFMDRLELSLRRAQRDGHLVAVMFVDLDRFKLVNDSFGHDAGDRLLCLVSQQLTSTLRVSDTLARFGGDEFTVLCEVTDKVEALEIAERLVASVNHPMQMPGSEHYISVSLGIALSGEGCQSAPELLRNADVAMLQAKEAGPGRIEVYEHNQVPDTTERLRTSNELHRALERGELELHYQPVVDLHTESLVGIEALVRWRHPTRGLLLPGEFIPLAEDSGVIVPLGRWVLEEACRQASIWHARRIEAGVELGRLNISVNVSARQLAEETFPEVVQRALSDSGLDPDKLWLEITESMLMRRVESTIEILGSLRGLGVHLEIDDFGTGYSSLSYLKRFPIQTLKVDRSFVDQIDDDSGDVAIVRAIIAMGNSLGLSVVAEGVERATQAKQLRTLGCFLAQGYLYGKPLPGRMLDPFPTNDLSAWHFRKLATAGRHQDAGRAICEEGSGSQDGVLFTGGRRQVKKRPAPLARATKRPI